MASSYHERVRRAIVKAGGDRTDQDLRFFVLSNLECLLWLGSNANKRMPDNDSSQDLTDMAERLTSFAIIECVTDAVSFYNANVDDVLTLGIKESAFDFNLTRNGHGTGFWDTARYPESAWPSAERLDDASRPYGSLSLEYYHGRIYTCH